MHTFNLDFCDSKNEETTAGRQPNHRSLRHGFNKHSDKGAKLQLRTLKGCSCFFGRKLLKKECANAR